MATSPSSLSPTMAFLLPHDSLPPYLRPYASLILLENVENANQYLIALALILVTTIFLQLRAFARPPPIPLKKLPKRPILNILFTPDDISTSQTKIRTQKTAKSPRTVNTSFGSAASLTSQLFGPQVDEVEDPISSDEDLLIDEPPVQPPTMDLPDSFAPLLSSSHMEILKGNLTADLIHALQVDGNVRMQHGRHEIPLDKDRSRPQLILDVPKGGCRLSALVVVGSDGFDNAQDLDVSIPTSSRSKPIVKNAGIVLDPPLPLSNVAPTLIHFPTLFEDSFLPTLRSIQIVRLAFDFIISISSLIEKCLWIIESKCQIHLSKIKISPIYKGKDDGTPQWRLSLSFSGHVLLFEWIPIPFISVTLPTFIIPQPHALLDKLLTKQPLASARLKRENIAEEKILLALLNTVETWNSNVKVLATPPAVGIDLTLPGGVTIAAELVCGRDPTAGKSKKESTREPKHPIEISSGNSYSSWTTRQETSSFAYRRSTMQGQPIPEYDSNEVTPWFLEVKAKGSIGPDKITFHLLKCLAEHEDKRYGVVDRSKLETSGSLAIWKGDEESQALPSVTDMSPLPLRKRASFNHRRTDSGHAHPALVEDRDTPTVAALFLFPDDHSSFHRDIRMLQYDYAFSIADHTNIDVATLTVGARHPFLKGSTMITAIFHNMYANGSVSAREGAIIDPQERHRKRNILRHLPATDFRFGVQHVYIPIESSSFSDDGLSLFLPEMDGGRMTIRLLGGIEDTVTTQGDSNGAGEPIEGLKMIADFDIESLILDTETYVKEFPELDIFEGIKLRTHLSGVIGGRIIAYLRPQAIGTKLTSLGPNLFNPLEAYEIVCSGSNVSVKMREFNAALGHRRIIFPSETSFFVNVVESVVDMGFEGKTECQTSWDFQGLSPILQVATNVGELAEDAAPEQKQQVSLLIAPLRQGRVNFTVSSVGGIKITKAATSREDKEGLFDWKFFNALISPDEESASRILKVLHDKRTMDKLLQVILVINKDLHRIAEYCLRQIWRAKEIFDSEGVSDPGHVIPMYKMARLISLFLTDGMESVDDVFDILQKIIAGDGLDTVKLKELLREHLEHYDDWAPELDRAIRWAALMLSPMVVSQPYIEDNVRPLAQKPEFIQLFEGIPSAAELYRRINEKPHLPLDPGFSSLVSQLAPYLSFRQIEYILEVRSPSDWQPADLRRIRYVFAIKRKVMEISESYGGLSFLPQSFLVSVFLGEATRTSLRATKIRRKAEKVYRKKSVTPRSGIPVMARLRGKRSTILDSTIIEVAESVDGEITLEDDKGRESSDPGYELGDCLLGPADVAIVLQSGLTSAMKSSTVVQLNQRMLLDLICSQPRSYAVAVLAEIGGLGQGSPRSLTSALMALLELDQTAFETHHQIDMHQLLESWLPGLKIPRREDHLAGGRWARQSYYEAVFAVATSILEDAEVYMALKGHIQKVRMQSEKDPIPRPKSEMQVAASAVQIGAEIEIGSKLEEAIEQAKATIKAADDFGAEILNELIDDEESVKSCEAHGRATALYEKAFDACSKALSIDKHIFQIDWFASFYQRNYDALMIKSVFDNVMDDVDDVRYWLQAMRNGIRGDAALSKDILEGQDSSVSKNMDVWEYRHKGDSFFLNPSASKEQVLVTEIIQTMIYDEKDRQKLSSDPLVRLLISNPPGRYSFAIVSAMGVITEGKRGLELRDAFERLEKLRGIKTIRADTGTARSFDYNAAKIEEAIAAVNKLKKPFGLLGYSQGCANALYTETLLLSGSPKQQQAVLGPQSRLVCRQLLFSAANGSFHGPATEKKIQRLIVMCEEFFKYQQGYVSRAMSSFVLELVNSILDSAHFHKFMGGAQTFLAEGCRAFWRESQNLGDVPTCTLRGVMEDHTTPESLEMISNLLTKQSGSALHDSQVHVFDAVGYPVYHQNRNGRLLKRCSIGEGAVQRTHHWSPLSDEVEFVRTQKDILMGSFDCAKDRHVFPWVEVNARFGFIQKEEVSGEEVHPLKLLI